MALNEQHEQRINFIVAIENADQVARVPVGGDSEQVAQRRAEELAKLGFREQLEKRRLCEVVHARHDVGHEFGHGG